MCSSDLTTLNEPTIKAEYIRRLNAGENPWLLAEELQNPVREMWGEILADPVNFAGFITKGFRAAGMLDDATRVVAKYADDAIELAADGRKAVSTANAVSKTQELATAVVNYTQKLKTGLTKVDTRLLAFTPESKRVQAAHKSL